MVLWAPAMLQFVRRLELLELVWFDVCDICWERNFHPFPCTWPCTQAHKQIRTGCVHLKVSKCSNIMLLYAYLQAHIILQICTWRLHLTMCMCVRAHASVDVHEFYYNLFWGRACLAHLAPPCMCPSTHAPLHVLGLQRPIWPVLC